VPAVVAAAGTGAPLMSAHLGWFIIDGVSELTPYAAARELLCDVVVVMGVSASGKSTVAAVVAQRLGWAHIDADDYHPQANIDKMSAGQPLTDDDRVPWLEAIRADLDRRRSAGESVVLSCSALKRKYRDVLRGGPARVHFVHLRASRDVLVARLDERSGHFFPGDLVDSQLAALEVPGSDEAALIVDATDDAADIASRVVNAWRA